MWIFIAVLALNGFRDVRAKTDLCPDDLVKETQNCFTEMAQAVQLESGPVAQSGTMTLDYKQIKRYCVEGGLISQFVQCVEDVTAHCQNATQTTILDRLVSPARVKAAVPLLCQKQDDIEKAGECMNTVMGQDSQCKNQAYDKVKLEMSKSIRNVTLTFLIQCSFFNALAACQKEALSTSCGSGLGEVHAHFLLSFIPNSCTDNTTAASGTQKVSSSNNKSTIPTTNRSTQPPTTTRKSEIIQPTLSGNSNKTVPGKQVKKKLQHFENGAKQMCTSDHVLFMYVLYSSVLVGTLLL
uniref:Uncharacterized protein n=1 Tax=Biomphalaria glabrata TaxID=6526 RepID=A0A2C9JX91_BIOGL